MTEERELAFWVLLSWITIMLTFVLGISSL